MRLVGDDSVQLGSPSTPAMQSPSSVLNSMVVASPYAKLMQTEFGEDFLDDSVVRRPLNDLVGYVSDYTANACTEPPPLFSHLPQSLDQIYGFKNEVAGGTEPLVILLRTALKILKGISVAKLASNAGLERDIAFWVNTALVYMIRDFVFRSGSPFESCAALQKSYEYSKYLTSILTS